MCKVRRRQCGWMWLLSLDPKHNSKILHTDENCRALRHIQEENRSILEKADPDTLVALGYTVCGICASELRK